VRDGEVAVSVVHRDATAGTNRLEAARQALQSQTAAREQAERRLVEAQETIRELQTQLGHTRLARDEAVQRAAEAKQASEQALAALQAELLETRAGMRQTEQRQQRLPARPTVDLSGARATTARRMMTGDLLEGLEETATAATETPAPARRRGRPPKINQPKPVEWWKPGWKERLR